MKLVTLMLLLFAFAGGCSNNSKPAILKTSQDSSSAKEFKYPPSMTQEAILDLYQVHTTNAPNKLLLKWGPRDSAKDLSRFNPSEFHHQAESFDATPFLFTDELLEAIESSDSIRWIRLGQRAGVREIECVAQMRQLNGLSLSGADLSSCDLEQLVFLKELRWLHLGGATLPTTLNLGQFPKLEFLKLDTVTTDDSILGSLDSCKSLRVLTLGSSNITDAGIQLLSTGCPNLEYLYVGNAKMLTAEAASFFPSFPKLKYLYLGGTALAKKDIIIGLQEKMPKCFVGFQP